MMTSFVIEQDSFLPYLTALILMLGLCWFLIWLAGWNNLKVRYGLTALMSIILLGSAISFSTKPAVIHLDDKNVWASNRLGFASSVKLPWRNLERIYISRVSNGGRSQTSAYLLSARTTAGSQATIAELSDNESAVLIQENLKAELKSRGMDVLTTSP